MRRATLARRITAHLDTLCNRIGNRSTGSPGNRQATAYVRDMLASYGLKVAYPRFRCIDWKGGAVQLCAGERAFAAYAGPYALPFDGRAPLAEASTLAVLRRKTLDGRILLLHGELAAEPLIPKGFVFYNPAEHQKLIRVLEEKQPAAILAATGKRPELVGALYPFPVFEDGDFDIPNAYMKDTDGAKLLAYVGRPVRLAFSARRIPATGHNVIATRRGSGRGRIVLTAHVDARKGTPGALDNASGVATLLAVGELLGARGGDRADQPTVEIAILNGEDYYAVPGQMHYLKADAGRWGAMRLAINLDDVGYRVGKTAYSFYRCSESLQRACSNVLAAYPGLTPGPPWVQGDHSMFVQQGVPALAFTAQKQTYLMRRVIHTERDRPELVDPHRLAELAFVLVECLPHPEVRATVARR